MMADTSMHESLPSSLSLGRYLAAPVEHPVNISRDRSPSAAPSYRSTQSHMTTLEDKSDVEGTDSLDPSTQRVQRQQTYKIGRSIGLMDRIRGVFLPSTLVAKMEDSIEVVTSDVADDAMFHRHESPWIVDVYVSPKVNSMDYHRTLCLLDTGCSHGNIVSKEFLDTLGFTGSDYQELTELERHGGVTMAGEPFPIEAAIFLSWHHNTSLKRFREMRFLVSSHAKNFDMIVGAQTILKYNLMSRPVFNLTNGAVRSSVTDDVKTRLTNERSILKSATEKLEKMIKKEKNQEKLVLLKAELTELSHLRSLKDKELSRELAKEADKSFFSREIEKHTKAWDEEHPGRLTEAVKISYQHLLKKKATNVSAATSTTTEKSSGNSKGTKKSPISTGSPSSRKA